MMKLTSLAAAIAVTSLLTACGSSSDSSSSDSVINVDNVSKVLETNADIAYAAYSDAVTTAKALQTALQTFREDPTEENFVAAKTAWLVAREPYGQTEVYRFRLSPIDSTDYSSEDGPEGDINAWPLGEALIDYVQTNDTDFGTDQVGVTANSAGINGGGALTAADAEDQSNNIIGDVTIDITADLLANTATADDEHDVIAGYHAIEFLLWGQDLNNDGETTDGTDRDEAVKTNEAYNYAKGGDRPLSDLAEGYSETDTYDSSNLSNRRHKFMEVAVEKLIDDLETVRDSWADGASYRTEFTTISSEDDAKQKLAEILTGMGTLSEGELAGERMQIAFSSNSQEDEHSCFSDNTHRDIWLNAEGVSNSYYGEYAGYDSTLDGTDDVTTNAVSGYGLDDYLADAGLTEVAASMVTALSTTSTAYESIDSLAREGTPFDVQIMDATTDEPAYDTIKALNAQSTVIADVAEALEIDGDVVVDVDASECDTTDPTTEC
ncbi:imelysin family protein [Oceanobacter sp. 5_MG-2023]|uniref:imelysin family protein n=1 Tax=Oceanobacter sp. 5_MG-2023 TaxID=3062645 RepID=UPI0026E47AB0|nr:imelysin family protein [Oceanobacter sp. 5_MG-2023]MDO6681897.1 imelysin family protein [Oceanobacter sp. 5_MG-2023]